MDAGQLIELVCVLWPACIQCVKSLAAGRPAAAAARAHQAGSHGPLPLRQRLVADRQISPRFLYLMHVELGGMASQSRLHLHGVAACLLASSHSVLEYWEAR